MRQEPRAQCSYKRVDKNIYGSFLIFFGQKIVFQASDRLLEKFSGKMWIGQNVGKNQATAQIWFHAKKLFLFK